MNIILKNLFNLKFEFSIKSIIIIFLFFLGLIHSSISANAQLSGTFTIGGTWPDYQTPEDAFDDLESFGTTDTVILLIRNGTYYINDDIDDIVSQFPIYVIAEDQLNPLVVFSPSNAYIQFWLCENINFRSIEFNSSSNGCCLKLYKCDNFSFNKCSFYSNPISSFTFDSSDLDKGLNITECYFDGNDTDIDSDGDMIIIKDNIFDGTTEFRRYADSVLNNSFNGPAIFRTGYIHNNVFNSLVRCNSSWDIKFHNNIVHGEADFSGTNLSINSNIFKEGMGLGGLGPDGILVYNNHIEKIVSFGSSNSGILKFYHNNVNDQLYYGSVQSATINIINNNFKEGIYLASPPSTSSIIKNNNFYPGHGFHGVNKFHYDPEYANPDSLYATNELLVGKGYNLTGYYFDMDGNLRNHNPTIGANEFFVTSDTISIMCGESLCLSTFSDTSAIQTQWWPQTFMQDTTEMFPLVIPNSNIWYHLSDSTGMIIDSIYIITEPFELVLEQDQTVSCGSYGLLYIVPQPFDSITFNWNPNNDVLFWQDYAFYAQPFDTTTYTLNLTHGLCGTFSDSITISLDPVPVAHVSMDSFYYAQPIVHFYNLSYCDETVEWEFGDGDFSYENDPIHEYPGSGTYYFTFIAYNDYGFDFIESFISIYYDLSDNEVISDQLKIVPNPNNGTFMVQLAGITDNCILEVIDLKGSVILTREYDFDVFNSMVRIELPADAKGIFIVRLTTKDNVITNKISVN